MAFLRRLFALALGVTLWTGLIAPAVAHGASGDDPNQIPGVPLTPGTVDGTAGGSVYDVVYRVVVPAHRVLLTQLSGSAGTDFDLYLFDGSAHDIYQNVGEVGASTGSTSSEFINYASVRGGTYFIDIASFGRTVGTFKLVTRILDDTTPPVVSVALDGGLPVTNDPIVLVNVATSDAVSGVAEMQFSTDGLYWDDWQAVQDLTIRQFSIDGGKTIFARVRDRLGNVSAVARATIVLDTTPPTVTGRTPEPGSGTSGLRPAIGVTFSEPIEPTGWELAGVTVADAQGTPIAGRLTYDAGTRTGTYVPDQPLLAGATYTISLGTVADLAGNVVVPTDSWTVRAIAQPVLALSASTTVVTPGTEIRVNGSSSGAPSATLVLEQSVAGGAFEPVVSLPTPPTGAFSQPVTVLKTSRFRLRAAATATSNEQISKEVTVYARPTLTFAGTSATVTRIVPTKTTVSLTAMVAPVAAGGTVTVGVYRYDTATKTYKLTTTIKRGTVSGHASVSWKPTTAGSYYLRLTTAATASYTSAASASYRWKIV